MSKVQLVARVTVSYGTPADPAQVAPGQSFTCEQDVAARLVATGAAELLPEAVAPVDLPSTEVAIPEGWRDLKADELVALAARLGAPKGVDTKGEATAYVAKIVDERAQRAGG